MAVVSTDRSELAAQLPQYAPAITAFMMRLNGRKVSRSSLACELGISVNTLYRRYGRQEIGRICEEQQLRVLKQIRARSELD